MGVVLRLAFLLCVVCAFAQPGAAQTRSCAEIKADRSVHARYLKNAQGWLLEIRAQLADMNTTKESVADHWLQHWTRERNASRLKLAREKVPALREVLEEELKDYDDAVDFWQAKRAELFTGGAASALPDAFRARVEKDLRKTERDEQRFRQMIREEDQEIARCQNSASKPVQHSAYHWSGTWYSGPFTMQVSGEAGKLTYNGSRVDDAGTDYEKTYTREGTCTVRGAEAECEWKAHYHDSDKTVESAGHEKLTYYRSSSGDTISSSTHQDTGSITMAHGTCPEISQCTGMYPGAEGTSTFTRKKP